MRDPRILSIIQLTRDLVSQRRCLAVGDPQAVVATATVIALAAVAASVAGTVVAASAAQSSAASRTAAANYNASIAQQNALAAEQQSNEDARRIRQGNTRVIGTERAKLAKAGLEDGSGWDVEYDSAVQGELNALTTQYKGRVEGVNYNTQAGQYSASAKNEAAAGTYAVAGTALTGASNTARAYSYSRTNQPTFSED